MGTILNGCGATKADGRARSWAAVPRISTSAFVTDYPNLQVQTPVGIAVFDIHNAAAATIRGVEVEATSLIGHGIQAGGHLAWLDAIYDRYIAVAVEGTTGDVSGNRLNNAPALAGRLWIEWTGDIGHSRRVSLSAESAAQSTVFFTPFNNSIQRQSPYGLLRARAEYGPGHRRWTISAYARNLTNMDYVTGTFGTPPTAYAGRPAPSRQFAVEFAVRR
jgi:iron complex outermembrane receptor protein